LPGAISAWGAEWESPLYVQYVPLVARLCFWGDFLEDSMVKAEGCEDIRD